MGSLVDFAGELTFLIAHALEISVHFIEGLPAVVVAGHPQILREAFEVVDGLLLARACAVDIPLAQRTFRLLHIACDTIELLVDFVAEALIAPRHPPHVVRQRLCLSAEIVLVALQPLDHPFLVFAFECASTVIGQILLPAR